MNTTPPGFPRFALSRFVMVASCLLVAVAVGGCGGGDADELPERAIYMSLPATGPLAERGRDLADGARLALDQTRYDTPDVRVALRVLDAANEPANLRTARADGRAIAYITLADDGAEDEPGDEPGAGGASDASGRQGRLLRITLAPDTLPAGARAAGGDLVHLLPSAEYGGMALAQAVADAAPRSVVLSGGDSPFGRAVLRGYRRAAANSPVRVAEARAEVGTAGGETFARVTGAPTTGEARAATTFFADHPSVARPPRGVTLVTPALARLDFPRMGRLFPEFFQDAYHRAPDRFAVFGYDAMGLALNAITVDGETDGRVTRAATLEAALTLRDRFGPIGHYDVLPDGQSTLYAFGLRPWPVDVEAEEESSRVIEVDR